MQSSHCLGNRQAPLHRRGWGSPPQGSWSSRSGKWGLSLDGTDEALSADLASSGQACVAWLRVPGVLPMGRTTFGGTD